MALYSQAREIDLNIARTFTGRNIFVKSVTGVDATGDGSEDAPYKTLAVAVANVVSGAGDKIIWVNEGSTIAAPVREATLLKIDSIDRLAILGVGNPVLGPPSPINLAQVTLPTIGPGTFVSISNNNLTFTAFPFAHGLAIGDYVWITPTTEAAPHHVHGVWEVTGVTASTVTCAALARHTHTTHASGGEPFVASDGYYHACTMFIKDCKELIVSNITFGTTTVQNDMVGGFTLVTADSNDTLARTEKVAFLNCTFFNSFAVFARIRTILAPVPTNDIGGGILIEECIMARVVGIAGGRSKMPQLAFGGMKDFVATRNQYTTADNSGAPVGVGMISWDGFVPVNGSLVALNTLNSSGYDPAGASTDGKIFRRLHADDTDTPLVRLSRNFYPESSGVQVIEVDDVTGKGDVEAAPFVNADVIPQLDDLVMGRDAEQAVKQLGTVGRIIGLAQYREHIHYEAGVGNTNTVPGVDGTPNNPVSDYATVLTLLASTGFKKVSVRGLLTILAGQSANDIFFQGEDPISDTVFITSTATTLGAQFSDMGIVTASVLAGRIATERCIIGATSGTVTGLDGAVQGGLVRGTIIPVVQGDLLLDRVNTDEIIAFVVDCQSGRAAGDFVRIKLGNMTGRVEMRNLGQKAAGANDIFAATIEGGRITLNANCKDPSQVLLGGEGTFDDNSVIATANVDVRDFLQHELVLDRDTFIALKDA